MRRLLPGAAAVTQGHVVLTQQLQQEASVRYFRYYRYWHEMHCDRRAPNVQVYHLIKSFNQMSSRQTSTEIQLGQFSVNPPRLLLEVGGTST